MHVRSLIAVIALGAPVAHAQEEADTPFSPPPMVEAHAADVPPTPPPVAPVLSAPLPPQEVSSAAPPPPSPERLNRVTWGPLPLLGGAVALEVERVVSERVTVFAGPRIGVFNGFGVGGSLGARLFFGESRAPAGFWAGPELYSDFYVNRAQVQGTTVSRRSFTLLALGLVGYTHVAQSGLTFSVGGGAGGGYADWQSTGALFPTTPGAASPTNYRGFIPALAVHLNTGYAF